MILCKDQAAYDALMALCDEFPDLIGHFKHETSVITPQQMMDLISKPVDPSVMLVDLNTVANIRQHKLSQLALREKMEVRSTGPEEMNQKIKSMAIRVEVQGNTDSSWLVSRFDAMMEKAKAQGLPVRRRLRAYIESKADGQNRVIINNTMMTELERIVGIEDNSPKVATVGGRPLRRLIEMRVIDESECASPTEADRGGYERSRKGRRDVVMSKKGNLYPLPKGSRGMSRVGRTRGR